MTTHQLIIKGPRPYFAELPYYLWGEVNYDSDGDCERPTDRTWTWFDLRNRETGETLGQLEMDRLVCDRIHPGRALDYALGRENGPTRRVSLHRLAQTRDRLG